MHPIRDLHHELDSGKLLLVAEASHVDCRIRMVSAASAQVRMRAAMSLPEDVVLWEQATELAYRCEVTWRKHDLVGLAILDICDRAQRRPLLDACAQPVRYQPECCEFPHSLAQ
jgi:hypothetical protein